MNRKKWIIFGVALSVVWAYSAGLRQHNEDVESATSFADLAYKTCMNDSRQGQSGAQACDEERQKNISVWMDGSDKNVAFTALAPIPLGWLAGYILLMLWRIQVAGFRAVFPWASLTRARKFAVCGCGIAVAAGCLMLALTVLNLYADTRVPVGLATPVTAFEYGEDSVIAAGTWTRHGASPGSEVGFPLQISKIVCTRSERRCTEALATVSEAGQSGVANVLLTPDLNDHDVTSWENGIITYKSDDLCASETYSINIKTKSMSGLGLAVKLHVKDTTISRADLTALAQEAHEKICPYSHATRGNIAVELTVEGA